MATAQLEQLAQAGQIEQFENQVLEKLGQGEVALADIAPAFTRLAEQADGARVATLGQMILDNADTTADPAAALRIASAALIAGPEQPDLRRRVADLAREAYAGTPGIDALIEASGLLGDRPPRIALRTLDLCVQLQPGAPLISRSEGSIVEVIDFDFINVLFTLRVEGRATTVPAIELARGYEPIDADDFRVLRALRPDRLAELLENDPVALVIGIIRSHHESFIDADELKHELVPEFLEERAWSKWWSKTRTQLKRNPHIIVEGRSPVILTYTARGRTVEDETRDAIVSEKEPFRWLAIIESYLREKGSRSEEPDTKLLEDVRDRLAAQYESARQRRPVEALTCALLLQKLAERGVPVEPAHETLAADLLRESSAPTRLIVELNNNDLWGLGLHALEQAHADKLSEFAGELFRVAPAGLLDRLSAAAMAGGRTSALQQVVDAAVADPVDYPEVIYWLWKGPKEAEGLNLPSSDDLLGELLDTVAALGRGDVTQTEAMKRFRERVKAALSLKNYGLATECMRRVDRARAITLRRQIDRMEGLGEVARARLLDALRDAHPELWQVKRVTFDAWKDPNVIWTTKVGYDTKQEERDQLVNVAMRENAKRIGEAASLGDLSENSEYKFALEERDLLRARLAKINQDLALARVLEPEDVRTDLVGVGSRVTLRDVQSGAERDLTFLGPFDADVDRGVLNYLAPLSQNVLGKRVGERTKLALEGDEHEYEVVAIAHGLVRHHEHAP